MMNNIVFSTRNIDDFISEVANEVVKRIDQRNVKANIPTDQPETLLTVSQAAEFLSLSNATIYGLIHKGEIPYMKRAKRVYFSRLELMEYIKSGRRKTTSEIEVEAGQFLRNKKRGS